jgi:hypothetical protein
VLHNLEGLTLLPLTTQQQAKSSFNDKSAWDFAIEMFGSSVKVLIKTLTEYTLMLYESVPTSR